MKYVKMLGLAAAALMAFVGASTASATVLCKTTGTGSPTGTTCSAGSGYAAGQALHAVNVGNTLLKDDESGATLISCTGSTIQGEVTNAGGTGTVSGPISKGGLTFTGCSQHVTVLKEGTLEIHWISGTHNGTLTSNGVEVTTETTTMFGNIHCIYGTNNTDLGEVTDGNPAIIHVKAVIPQVLTSGLCPKKARLEATYEITTPKPLSVAGASAVSSTILCKTTGTGSPTGTTCPDGMFYGVDQPIHAVNVGNLLIKDDGSNATLISCKESTIQGEVTNAGGTGTVSGPISKGGLTFTGCDQHVTVLKEGTIEIHWISGTHNGTLTSNGAEVTTETTTIFGNIHCIYVTTNSDLGELTDGNPAIVHANAIIAQVATSGLCPAKARWEATYEITTPKPLSVAGHL